MNPSTSAFMIDACGEASTGRKSPGSASPNWKVRASITIVRPDATAAAITPRNFTFSCAAGVDPSQYPVFKSVIACPETDSAVHTIPAMAITKNMPLVPDNPNCSNTTDEMMTVNMVMPDTGLRAVVAIAFAATDVKKNENTSVITVPIATTLQATGNCARYTPTPMAPSVTPRNMAIMEMSRSVRSGAATSVLLKTRNEIENEPATIRSDLMIPNIPAVA